jgi:hypothetical protein
LRDVEHIDVAAYVLGALDKDEDEAFRTHLETCEECAKEVAWMSQVSSLLGDVELDRVLDDESMPELEAAPEREPESEREANLEPKPEPEPTLDLGPEPESSRPNLRVLDGALAGVRSERRRYRRRMSLVAVAAGVVVLAAAATVGLDLGRSDTTSQGPVAAPVPSLGPTEWARALLLTGKIYNGSNNKTGVSAKVGIESKVWGTHVAIQLSNISGPKRCQLVAVGKDGTTEVVTSWVVPPEGYGKNGRPPLLTHGGAAFRPNEIDRFEVRTLDGQNLVTVPV